MKLAERIAEIAARASTYPEGDFCCAQCSDAHSRPVSTRDVPFLVERLRRACELMAQQLDDHDQGLTPLAGAEQLRAFLSGEVEK